MLQLAKMWYIFSIELLHNEQEGEIFELRSLLVRKSFVEGYCE